MTKNPGLRVLLAMRKPGFPENMSYAFSACLQLELHQAGDRHDVDLERAAQGLLGDRLVGAVLAAAGRLPLGPAPLAAAWALTVLGSLPLYALGLALALRLGRNASIGMGATGTLLAFFSVGGLAHGLMTGELTGALATPLSWVPFAWPARLGSLGVEVFIDFARTAGTLLATALAGAVLALAAVTVLLAWFRRFEDGRADA